MDIERSWREGWLGELLFYLAIAAAALVIAFSLFRLGSADLRVPVTYDGDGLYYGAQIKGTLENRWNLDNPALGAPGVANGRDFPTPDNLELVMFKALSLVSRDYAVVLNLYLLLMYPLTAITAVWVIRRLGVSRLPAVVAGLLYAFLPYWVARIAALGQTTLASGFLVPLLVWVAVASAEKPLLFRPGGETAEKKRWWAEGLAAVVICALLAANGLYYAFFGVLVLLGAGLFGALRKRDWRPLLSTAALVGVILVVAVAMVAPTILYHRAAGPNPEVFNRAPIESELWGLKIDQMLLPVQNHTIGVLAHLHRYYVAALEAWAPFLGINENVSLGIVGSIGLVALFVWLLFLRGSPWSLGESRDRLMERLSVLNGFTVLIATYGGFALLIGLVFPQIRVYARIFVYVAFFCFVAVAVLLDRLGEQPRKTRFGRAAFAVGLLVVLAFGLLDQVPTGILPKYAATKARWQSDAQITREIEQTVPAGAMIFTLPYMPFPESPPPYPGTMNDYDLLRGYMHSTKLRWSYAAMKGRADDLWQRKVAALPPAEMVAALKSAGFKGLWLDTDGYADKGASISAQIQAATGTAPLKSQDGRVLFFAIP